MSYMYFGKVNINSNIFEVYNNPSKIGEILKYLFEAIDQEKRLKVDEKNNIWAKFINIEKDYAKQYIYQVVLLKFSKMILKLMMP